MRYLVVSILLCVGCSVMDPKQAEFDEKKKQLQQEVELLSLEKRKLLLQRQIEWIENSDIPVAPPSKH